MIEQAPPVSYGYWGGQREEDAARLEVARRKAQWYRDQREREDAQALGDLVRDALLEGAITRVAIMTVLVEAPPPPLSISQRLRILLRRCARNVLRLTTRRTSHAH
ncbi:hypothetical protein GCM10028796_21490 [Ramlibacter monticola]|uniref:Uncharacterized protein n=1 Tax=Ramlibacter monticola TaxID=1926872 RepID=A0A937CTC7_9BURK|nr:hypothetical protein [Ramlibacter monticola]MBL0392400.1 hypothetical protein [Ramlibacter monticola]